MRMLFLEVLSALTVGTVIALIRYYSTYYVLRMVGRRIRLMARRNKAPAPSSEKESSA